MKITEKWHITGRVNDFTLTERLVRKDPKTGADKISERQTYHPTIEQCLNKIVKQESIQESQDGTIDTAEDLKRFLEQLKLDIKEIADAAQVAVPTDIE